MLALSIIQQRRSLVIAVAAVAIFIFIWLSLSNPQTTYIPPLDSPPAPIPFSSSGRLLPFRYWQHRAVWPERYLDHSCMKLPSVSDLQYAASGWQLVQVDNGSVYVYGAYYDARFEEPLVRILVYTDVAPVPKLFCQLWFPNDNEPQTELATPQYGWRPEWGGPTDGVNEPYILACKCRRHHPEKDTPPVAAAVVTAPCGVASNVLDVQNAPFDDPAYQEELPPRNGTSVAVCIKWLHFRDDVSLRIIEWMQLMKHFGVEKVYMYIVRLHANARRALKYYEDQGFTVVTELSHPPQISGFQQDQASQDFRDMRRELLPLNDCLYRSIGHHDWLAVIDVDEVIVPTPEDSWPKIIEKEAEKAANGDGRAIDAMSFPNYFVLDGAQKDLAGPAAARILSHTWRAKKPSPPGCCIKSFFNVSSVTAMHNHSPMSCKTDCHIIGMEQGPGMMLHFRHKCQYDAEDCEELHDVIKDDRLARWRAPVLQEMRAVIKELGLDARLE